MRMYFVDLLDCVYVVDTWVDADFVQDRYAGCFDLGVEGYGGGVGILAARFWAVVRVRQAVGGE
jgi:hypothetical protein